MKFVNLLAPCMNKTSLPRAVSCSEILLNLSTPTASTSIPTWTTTGSVIKHSCSKRRRPQFLIHSFSNKHRQIRGPRMKIAMIPSHQATSCLMISKIAHQSLVVRDSGLAIPQSSHNLKMTSQLPEMTLTIFRMSAIGNRFRNLIKSCRRITSNPP